jgi:uncharacterized membrane protein
MSGGITNAVDRFLRRGMRFWLFPAVAIVLALVTAPLVRSIDADTGWRVLGFTPEGASTVLTSLSTAMFTFLVFVISSLLLVVQLASAQLTPRIIVLAFESGYTRRAIAAFAFAFTFTLSVSGRITSTVPQLSVALSVGLCLLSIGVFFHFANRLAVDLRPVSVLTNVGEQGLRVLDAVYPSPFAAEADEHARIRIEPSKVARVVTYGGDSGSVVRVSTSRIVQAAAAADVVVEMVPQVGDFITRGDPLFQVAAGRADVDGDELRRAVLIGAERTLEQDPRFAFRIIVDIANKALSPAINDPTTAVLAIDQIHKMLLRVGRRRLDEGVVRDDRGQVRFLHGTPDWDDYVSLGITEIRQYGAGSMQVSRRLFALLTHLLQVLPGRRAEPLRREIKLLRESVNRAFPDAEDREAAQVPDTQGMGGAEPAGSEPPIPA